MTLITKLIGANGTLLYFARRRRHDQQRGWLLHTIDPEAKLSQRAAAGRHHIITITNNKYQRITKLIGAGGTLLYFTRRRRHDEQGGYKIDRDPIEIGLNYDGPQPIIDHHVDKLICLILLDIVFWRGGGWDMTSQTAIHV